MKQLIGIALLLAIGFFVSHRWFGKAKVWGAARFFYLTGEEFLLLGVLLGPLMSSVLDRDTLESLEPFVGLGLGYVGFVFGMQFDRTSLRAVPRRYYLASAGLNLCVVAILGGGLAALGSFWAGDKLTVPLVLLLAATGVGTSTSFLYLVDRGSQLGRTRAFQFLRFSSVFDDAWGIALFGVALCWMRPEGVMWVGVSIAVGLISTLFLSLATRISKDPGEELLVLLGAVLFTGGLAALLRLSPVFTNAIAGFLFAQFRGDAVRYHDRLLRLEKPIYLTMLVLAGALLRPSVQGVLLLLVAYVVLRLTGKFVGGIAAGRVLGGQWGEGHRLGVGQVAQSEMSVALLVNLLLLYPSGVSHVAVTAVLLAVVASDLFSSVYFSKGYRKAWL